MNRPCRTIHVTDALAFHSSLRHMIAGMFKTDFSGYSERRDGAIKTLQVALPPKEQRRFLLHTPLTRLDKAVTWRLSDDLSGMDDLTGDETETCHPGNHVLRLPCCREARSACDLRHKGWKAFAAGIHV